MSHSRSPIASCLLNPRSVWLVAGLLGAGLLAGSRSLSNAPERAIGAAALAAAANGWLESLAPPQAAKARRPFADPQRTDWHFVPKFDRKGLPLRDMTPAQQDRALGLLRGVLSEAGYTKAQVIMHLEELLRVQEGKKAKNVRDPERYFFTIFGTPSDREPWGLSVEGHHLSFNFTLREGRLVDSTPQFLGANPATVKTGLPGLPAAGTRILRDEETLAFDLVQSLDEAQRKQALIAAEPPAEIRAAGAPQPPADPPVGIRRADLRPEQQAILRRIVEAYCSTMTDEVAAERLRLIDAAAGGWDAIAFAWSGAMKPGVGHGYRVEGPTFSIEFVNVQPDAEGNPANHIHCVWRDRSGDFDLPAR